MQVKQCTYGRENATGSKRSGGGYIEKRAGYIEAVAAALHIKKGGGKGATGQAGRLASRIARGVSWCRTK